MLREIKQLLRERGGMTLRELAVHFKMETTALEPMLQVLVDKGTVRVAEAGCDTGQKSCTGCSREDRLIYSLA